MSTEIEIISDGDGALILGEQNAIQEFSVQYGLSEEVRRVPLDRLSRWLHVGAEAANRVLQISQQSGMYMKLTPESAEALKKAGGLMPTAKEGVSHLMLGKTGDHSMKWLQADTSASALIGNPAVLTGMSGLLTICFQEFEAKKLNEFMAHVDARLDEVLANQRNETLADIETAAEQIEEAQILFESGGDPQTIWERSRSADERITTVQNKALKSLGDVAESVKQADSSKELKQLSREVKGKINLWLSVLARCLELKDQINVIELDHVMRAAPEKYDGHREGLIKNRQRRQDKVIDQTSQVLAALNQAGALAVGRTIIHPYVAKRLVEAINITSGDIHRFHKALSISADHKELELVSWPEAWKDPDQRKEAAKTSAKGVAVGGAMILGVAAKPAVLKLGTNVLKVLK